MNRRAPTPIRSTPTSAPIEAMVAKQQAHIDQLVMQNRTLEQTVQKLKTEVIAEKQRHEGTLQQVKQQFGQERTQWQEGCEAMQTIWRTGWLRVVTELEKERSNVFKMQEELRLARLAKLQRDYQIGQFQIKEMELEDRVVALREELEDVKWTLQEEQRKRAELKEQLRQCAEQLDAARDEHDHLQVRHGHSINISYHSLKPSACV